MLPGFAATSTRNALRAGLRRGERAQLALEVDRGGRLETTMPVARTRRALLREDLARPVGDVLARHLDEAERRDLDDVRLRPVALELVLQRGLDGRRFDGFAMSMKSMTMIPPMSRSRSWRTTSFTASRLFFVIVSSRPRARSSSSASRRSGRCSRRRR
jgi:hypothetical protein